MHTSQKAPTFGATTDNAHEALRECARTLFVATYYRQEAIEAMVTAAPVSKGALHHYFADKARRST